MRNPFKCLSAVALLAACSETGPSEAPPAATVVPAQLMGGEREYEVRITNLTGGQPRSPGVIATHEKNLEVWAPGSPASEGIRQIAENGDDAPAVAELSGAPGVFDVLGTGLPPVHRVGGPGPSFRSFRITARGNANHLSVAVMLICTNDGFTGVHGVPLPGGFKPEEFLAQGYDAGTESNDQVNTHVVDPCGAIGPVAVAADGQNLRTPTPGGVIRLHPGIQPGVGDLSATDYGWTNPVASITVHRVK